jgi:hypothetical protein
MTRITVAGLVLACGSAALAESTPAMSPKELRSGARVVGHFYVNMATGEVIGSTDPVARPRGLSGLVWITDNDIPCAGVNGTGPYTRSFVAIHDDPADVGDPSSGDLAYRSVLLDWADAPHDTVIDTLQVSTYSDHPDVDADDDGMADGVAGLASEWWFHEADNGFYACNPVGLIQFRLENIPGNLTPGEIEGYVYTIDLASDFDDNLAFELGDSDGDPQGAGVHNPFIWVWKNDIDLDGDGLVDFSYSRTYIQPGVLIDDQDNPIGDPSNRARTYSALSAPRMELAADPPTTFSVLEISSGQEDAFDILAYRDDFESWVPYGTFWYGGFSCDRDGDCVFEGDLNGSDDNNDGFEDNDYRAHGSFFMAMYGPSGTPPCPADLFPALIGDGQLNFFDISYYLDRFAQADSAADFFPPGGDGVFNFFDVSAFMAAFNAGCP